MGPSENGIEWRCGRLKMGLSEMGFYENGPEWRWAVWKCAQLIIGPSENGIEWKWGRVKMGLYENGPEWKWGRVKIWVPENAAFFLKFVSLTLSFILIFTAIILTTTTNTIFIIIIINFLTPFPFHGLCCSYCKTWRDKVTKRIFTTAKRSQR